MKHLQMQLEKIRADAAECLLTSNLAANGKPELFATLPENLNALALHVEETIATNDERATRLRRMLLWSLAIVLATIAGAAFFWANSGAEKDSSSVAIVQSKTELSPAPNAEPSPAQQDSREQAMGPFLSIYQGDRKILTEQLGALAARVDILERALDNLGRTRVEIAGPSNKQSVGSEENPTAAETKPSAQVEKPVRAEEKRAATLEKPAVAETKADAKQSGDVPPGTGNPFIEPVDQVAAIPVPKQAELDLRKRAIGAPGCTHFRTFDPVSGTYTSFDGRRRQCR